MSERRQRTRALVAGLLMGAGLGGFFDGIVFHQILQWHNMLSGWIPPDDLVSVKVNMVWDGYFHLAVWLITIAGLAVLLQAVARTPGQFPSRYVVGALLAGWGIFNLAEGIIDHHVLGVHRVHPASDMAMNMFVVACVAPDSVLNFPNAKRPGTPRNPRNSEELRGTPRNSQNLLLRADLVSRRHFEELVGKRACLHGVDDCRHRHCAHPGHRRRHHSLAA